MIFGEFLIEKNIVREEDLLKALDAQRAQQIPLGQLAVKEGFLEPKQLFKILTAQREQGNGGGHLGMIAVNMGFMTLERMEALVKMQTETSELLGDILVEQGSLTRSELLLALKNFRSKGS